MTIGLLDGCQNYRCRKVAVKTVKAIDGKTDEVLEERKFCAYCAGGVETDEHGVRIEIEDL